MKQKIVILMILSMGFTTMVKPQDDLSDSGFLFGAYQDAIVHYKGGLRSQEKINYNLLDGKLYFIDQKDGYVKVVAGVENIIIVKIGDRNFIPVNEGIQEVMPTNPLIYVLYKAKGKIKASNSGYGGTSEISSISTYTELRQDGTSSKLKKNEMKMTGRYNCYWIEKNGEKRKFAHFKQFLKLYPSHKELLDNHIKSNQLDFNDVAEIVNLCLYAESLE